MIKIQRLIAFGLISSAMISACSSIIDHSSGYFESADKGLSEQFKQAGLSQLVFLRSDAYGSTLSTVFVNDLVVGAYLIDIRKHGFAQQIKLFVLEPDPKQFILGKAKQSLFNPVVSIILILKKRQIIGLILKH